MKEVETFFLQSFLIIYALLSILTVLFAITIVHALVLAFLPMKESLVPLSTSSNSGADTVFKSEPSFLLSGITMNARTLMFNELSSLLLAVPAHDASEKEYETALLEGNCANCRTLSSRQKTWMYLRRLYRCNPHDPLFQTFRILWDSAPDARPLLAFQMAWTSDPILRRSADYFLPMAVGTEISSASTISWTLKTYPSLSPGAAGSTARNLNSSWNQGGFIEGTSVRRRCRVTPLPENAVFALWLGSMSGLSGSLLFHTPMCALLDMPPDSAMILAKSAASRGLIGFKRIDTVIEVSFQNLPDKEYLL